MTTPLLPAPHAVAGTPVEPIAPGHPFVELLTTGIPTGPTTPTTISAAPDHSTPERGRAASKEKE